jgi:hypothetical protein
VYAKNAVLELTPGPGVSIQEVLGQSVSWRGNVAQVALGDMSRDESRDIFVKLHAGGHKDGAAIELADAVVLFDHDSEPGKRLERRVYLEATSSQLPSAIEEGRNREVEREAARAEAAAQTLREIERARQGDKAAAASNLERASSDARRRAKLLADPELDRQAAQMEQLEQVYENGSAKRPAPTAAPVAARDASPAARDASPAASPASPRPSPPKPSRDEHTLREVHDSAIQRLQ